MFEKLLTFLNRIFRKTNKKLLAEGIEIEYNNNDFGNFRKKIRVTDGRTEKELIKNILDEKNNILITKEQTDKIQERLVGYIDVLIKNIDKCQMDIAIKQIKLKSKYSL